MADNIKISELTELTSGSLGDATIFPVVDGGTTKKASLSSLQSYLTDDLATDAELSTQISNVNSTINGLTTDDISEGTNEYYTNAKVDARINSEQLVSESAQIDLQSTQNYISGIKARLDAESVLSGSATFTTSSITNFPTEVSRSAAAAGFGTGGGGGGAGDIEGVTAGDGISGGGASGTVTVTLDTGSTHFTQGVSASAAASGFGAGGEGGGGSDGYVQNVTFSGTTLTFTGQGSAFSSTVDLSSGDLLESTDLFGYLATSVYQTDSASFASRIDAGGGGGGSVPNGTVSSSAQIYASFSGSNLVSSSQQIDGSQIDLTSLTTDDIGEGITNRYYANSLVLPYLNTLGVLSGSAGGGFDVSGTNIVSSSTQIETLGFLTTGVYGAGTASLQQQINDISSSAGSVSLSDANVFQAIQKFASGIEVTGSVLINNGSFSGSGAQLFDIPADAIVGGVTLSGSSISDGANTVSVNSISGVTLLAETGSILANGNIVIQSGSYISGSGEGLFNIPGNAIIGGVDGQKIASSSFSASIEDGTGNFIVGPFSIFKNNIYSSGSVTAQSISVGSSGTPTIYSANNINLSASNAVVVTDSPLRVGPFTDTTTGSFTPQEGDIVYSSTSDDFYGYKVVNSTGSWYSFTAGTVTEVEWDTLIGVPSGLVSASSQITDLGGGLLSSSAQILPSGAAVGTVYFEDSLDNMSGSSDFTYTAGTRTLNVNKVVANELVYNTSLTGAGNDTGSYGRVETDALNINGAIEFPVADGTINQVLKTDGNGNLDFAAFADVLGNDNLTTTGTITMGTGSVTSNLSVVGTLNLGSPVHSTINNQSAIISVDSLSLQSSGSLLLSSSVNVTIEDVLVLPERTTNPSNPPSGSLIVSSSGGQLRPYFWDGSNWKAISFQP